MDDLHPKTGSPDIDPEKLPAIFPVMTASRLLHIGRDRTYELGHKGEYPVRVLDISGRSPRYLKIFNAGVTGLLMAAALRPADV